VIILEFPAPLAHEPTGGGGCDQPVTVHCVRCQCSVWVGEAHTQTQHMDIYMCVCVCRLVAKEGGGGILKYAGENRVEISLGDISIV